MASNEPGDIFGLRKKGNAPTSTPNRFGGIPSHSQASLSSFFASEPPPGTPAPPRFDSSQFQSQHQGEGSQAESQAEPPSIYETLNMIRAAQETAQRNHRDLALMVKNMTVQVQHLTSNTTKLERNQNLLHEAMAQTFYPLIQKVEEQQGLLSSKVTKQLEEVQTLLSRPAPPPHPPAVPAMPQAQPSARAPAAHGTSIARVQPARAQPTRAQPAQRAQQQQQQQQQQQPQQQQQQQQQQQPQQSSNRSYANVARANNQNQEFQVVQRRKAAKKADPLFKPDFSRANREVIVECNAQVPYHQNPSEIRAKINAGIPDAKCHFITARKTLNNNIVLETKFDTSAETALLYKHEMKDTLLGMRIHAIEIRANSKWSKFIVHGIPTAIGDGLDAGQLVASEIRNNYGEKLELAQIPRWITTPEKRTGKEHSSMIIALPGSFTTTTLGLKNLLLFDRRCTLETYFNIREDTQCRNCLEFGHRQEQCTHETGRCGHCAEDHTTDDHPCKVCSGGVKCTHSPIRCYNCKGFHKAIDRACPERAKATLKASLRFNESRPQKIASAMITVAPAAPAPVAPVVPAPPAPESTIQVPATPAQAPVENDHDMGNI